MSIEDVEGPADFFERLFGFGSSVALERPMNILMMPIKLEIQRTPLGSTGSPSAATRHLGWFSAGAMMYCAVRSFAVAIMANCRARVRGVLHASYSRGPVLESGGLVEAYVRTPMVE